MNQCDVESLFEQALIQKNIIKIFLNLQSICNAKLSILLFILFFIKII